MICMGAHDLHACALHTSCLFRLLPSIWIRELGITESYCYLPEDHHSPRKNKNRPKKLQVCRISCFIQYPLHQGGNQTSHEHTSTIKDVKPRCNEISAEDDLAPSAATLTSGTGLAALLEINFRGGIYSQYAHYVPRNIFLITEYPNSCTLISKALFVLYHYPFSMTIKL